MRIHGVPDGVKKVDFSDCTLKMPPMEIPSFRLRHAIDHGYNKKILIFTCGGIGDLICAEPTIRWAAKRFAPYAEIHVSSQVPELYQHIPLKSISHSIEKPVEELGQYLVFKSIAKGLEEEFMVHHYMHCVDYHSTVMFRCQLPVSARTPVVKPPGEAKDKAATLIDIKGDIVIHPGLTWPSRTFPVDWWEAVIRCVKEAGLRPVLIGGHAICHADGQVKGVLPVDSTGCLDLRGRLTLLEAIAVCQRAKVVLTNDSAPLHFAATGNAHIGFVSTSKHPDHLMHWRRGIFGYKMRDFSCGGVWQNVNDCPNTMEIPRFDVATEDQVRSWLPDPLQFSRWGIQKCLAVEPNT